MSQIDELQSRLAAAMERIGTGLETLANSVPETAEADPDVVTALEEEKLANAQLEERLKSIRSKHDKEIEALKAELANSSVSQKLRADLASQSEAMARLDMDVQRLRQSNDQLRESNASLRGANEQGVGEPNLINKAMLAELEGMRASRATDTAEASAILSKLEPLLANAANLPDGEET
jgi:chromosome segregation ATPase